MPNKLIKKARAFLNFQEDPGLAIVNAVTELNDIVEEGTRPFRGVDFASLIEKTIVAKGDQGERGEQGPTGPQGIQGEKGDRGPAGKNGKDGKDGSDGKNGKDGKDGTSPSVPEVVKALKDDARFIASVKGERGEAIEIDNTEEIDALKEQIDSLEKEIRRVRNMRAGTFGLPQFVTLNPQTMSGTIDDSNTDFSFTAPASMFVQNGKILHSSEYTVLTATSIRLATAPMTGDTMTAY